MLIKHRVITGAVYNRGGRRRWDASVCNVHVSMFGQPGSVRILRERLRFVQCVESR